MAIEFSEILLEVVARRASDLHLTAGAPPTLRERGSLKAISGYPALTPDDTREFIYSILSTDQRRRLETDLQLDFAYLVPGKARFRVNTFFQRGALAAAFRLVPAQMVAIDQLGLPAIVHQLTLRPRGLVLVTGPTGSGKTTSLAAMIDEINATRAEHIITIEDPIEFLHTHKRSLVSASSAQTPAASARHSGPLCARTPM